jgi:hypothetical protein
MKNWLVAMLLLYGLGIANTVMSSGKPVRPTYELLDIKENRVKELEDMGAKICGRRFAVVVRDGIGKNLVFFPINKVEDKDGIKTYVVTMVFARAEQVAMTLGNDAKSTPTVSWEGDENSYYLFTINISKSEYFGSPCLTPRD